MISRHEFKTSPDLQETLMPTNLAFRDCFLNPFFETVITLEWRAIKFKVFSALITWQDECEVNGVWLHRMIFVILTSS